MCRFQQDRVGRTEEGSSDFHCEEGKGTASKTYTPYQIKHMGATAEAVNHFLATYGPPVLDPFCGGGSIPLEAQRLGLRAYGSDLNPVAVLINKALIEIPPKFAGMPPVNPEYQKKLREEKAAGVWDGAQGLAEDVRYYGRWLRDEAQKRIGHLYPKVTITKEMAKDRPHLKEYVGEELTVIAWLWARTVASPSPAFQGVHVPLVRSFWLGRKKGKEAWAEPILDRSTKSYHFTVRTGTPSSQEKKDIEAGTKLGRGCKFRCLLSNASIPEEHIKSEAIAGRLGARLLAIVAESQHGRVYVSPDLAPPVRVEIMPTHSHNGIDAPLANDPRNLWCLGYGLDTFDKLFTERQLVALTACCDLIGEARIRIAADAEKCFGKIVDSRSLEESGAGAVAYSEAVATYLAFAQSKACNRNTSLCVWETSMDRLVATFGRQAIPMVWDFAETNPFAGAGGDIYGTVESLL